MSPCRCTMLNGTIIVSAVSAVASAQLTAALGLVMYEARWRRAQHSPTWTCPPVHRYFNPGPPGGRTRSQDVTAKKAKTHRPLGLATSEGLQPTSPFLTLHLQIQSSRPDRRQSGGGVWAPGRAHGVRATGSPKFDHAIVLTVLDPLLPIFILRVLERPKQLQRRLFSAGALRHWTLA